MGSLFHSLGDSGPGGILISLFWGIPGPVGLDFPTVMQVRVRFADGVEDDWPVGATYTPSIPAVYP